MSEKALRGLKICEFAWAVAGPLVGEILAQHGATVVRIETERRVDILRVMPPFRDHKPGIDRSAMFANCNANKYSLALDIGHPAGQEVAKRLAKWADVVTENFAPGRMTRWGLSYEDLQKIKPDVIMLSTSHQGQSGPYASHPGYGTHLASLAGFVEITGWPDRDGYQLYGAYTDWLVPPLSTIALLAAIDYRTKTGKGQHIDISQFEASMHFLAPLFLDYQVNGRRPERAGNRSSCAAPHGVFRAKGEDRWCAIGVFTDEHWRNFCCVVGKPQLATDSRFATLSCRKDNEGDLEDIVEEWTVRRTAEEIMMVMQRAGVPAGVVYEPRDLYGDPQLAYRGHFVELAHPEIGSHHYDSVPFRLSLTPRELSTPGPCLGQHSEYICREILAMSDEEFSHLVTEGVLR